MKWWGLVLRETNIGGYDQLYIINELMTAEEGHHMLAASMWRDAEESMRVRIGQLQKSTGSVGPLFDI